MKIVEIKNELLHSCTYLVGNYLIDCGDGKTILSIIEQYKIQLKGIFLTHCHQDHIYGLPIVVERFPDIKIYCSHETFIGLQNEELNLQYMRPEYAFTFSFVDNVCELSEGVYEISDGFIVEVISCKGHSNDCLSFVIGNDIFTGDAYIPFAKVFTKWPTSNKKDAKNSIERITELAKNRNLTIKPGHWQ